MCMTPTCVEKTAFANLEEIPMPWPGAALASKDSP